MGTSNSYVIFAHFDLRKRHKAVFSKLYPFTFFPPEKLSEATRKMANLKSELSASQQAEHRHRAGSPTSPPSTSAGSIRRRRSSIHATLIRDKESKQQQMTTRKIHDIKLAFSEFYLSLILLQNYQTLNFTGFRKILKKHDKVRLSCKIKSVAIVFDTKSFSNVTHPHIYREVSFIATSPVPEQLF